MYRFLKPVLVSLAYWLIVPSTTPAVHCMDRKEIINTMNVLLANPGWQTIDVTAKETATNTVFNSQILLARVEPDPIVTDHNVDMKLRLMSIVLSCKYAEIVLWYVEALRLILVENHRKMTQAVTNWYYFWEIMQKINNIRPFLVNMLRAMGHVNHMDVALTVTQFELDLWALITHMDTLYQKHEFVTGPLPIAVMRPDLLGKMYETFKTAFVTYSLSTIGFLDGYCHIQLVPNRVNFERYYTDSQPTFTRPMDLCDFLTSKIDSTIEENIKLYYNDLGFQ